MRRTPFGHSGWARPLALVGLAAFSWGCDSGSSGSAPSPVPSLEVVMTTTGGLTSVETIQEVWSDGRVVMRWSFGNSPEKYFSAGELLPVRAVVHSGDFRALAPSYGPEGGPPGCTALAHRLSVSQGGTEQVVRGFSGYNPAVLDRAISELNALGVKIYSTTP